MVTRNSSSNVAVLLLILSVSLATSAFAFKSDEILVDDDEFGIEGARSSNPVADGRSVSRPSTRKRLPDSSSDTDSKVQFVLEHAFGGSDFSPAGTFSARVKTSSHGGQTLTKLRLSRNAFSETEKENFSRLLEEDDFYTVRLPSNVLSLTGREHVVSSVRVRCLPRDSLDEYFVVHMEGVNIVAVNYGSPGSCPYPRELKLPSKWAFKSHTVLKNSNQAPRTPMFMSEVDENGEAEELKPPEKSFWAKYWMYLIPLGVILSNAISQAMNMPEEPGSGQPGSQTQVVAGQGQAADVRRR